VNILEWVSVVHAHTNFSGHMYSLCGFPPISPQPVQQIAMPPCPLEALSFLTCMVETSLNQGISQVTAVLRHMSGNCGEWRHQQRCLQTTAEVNFKKVCLSVCQPVSKPEPVMEDWMKAGTPVNVYKCS
jgi:hypothetical protein